MASKQPRSYDRQIEVRKRRLEGAKAADEGRHPQTCPYNGQDAFQWMNGFTGLWGTVEDCQLALDSAIKKKKYFTQQYRIGLGLEPVDRRHQ